MEENHIREQVIAYAKQLNSQGMVSGTSGNISARIGNGMLITPSSIPFESLRINDLILIDFTKPNQYQASINGNKPSSEWRLHFEVLNDRPEIQAIVHCHSIFATAIACHGKGIPSFHYMVAIAGGNDIRCAPYATFGSKDLCKHALNALKGRLACLLANHGQITLGNSIKEAFDLAIQVEDLAKIYIQANHLGPPNNLSFDQMEMVKKQFEELSYGNR